MPGKVIYFNDKELILKMSIIRFGGIIKKVVLTYVLEVKIGDRVSFHGGFALNIIDREKAGETLTYIKTNN
ncbi:HypC/HybG/HupF family hydrogenase formation chaperone [Hyella patelloides]|nr:HypC/HybG/HupF family hydrogenase formation chaperone [Hyella patelloides]